MSDGALSSSVSEFDDIMSGPFQNFLNLSKKIGGDVATQGDMVNAAFKAQREYILLASKAKQPSASDVPALLKPTSDKISEIQSFREKQRRSEFFNHLSAVSESIPALGWVTMAPTPGPFVKEMNDAGQFYTNRVLKDWKEKDKTHVEWTKAWVGTLTDIQAYVKKNHTTGLVWNPKGGDAKTLSGSSGECRSDITYIYLKARSWSWVFSNQTILHSALCSIGRRRTSSSTSAPAAGSFRRHQSCPGSGEDRSQRVVCRPQQRRGSHAR